MSLRTKILLVLLVLIVGYVGLTYAIQRTLVYPSFDELQSNLAATNLARVEGALDTVVEAVNAMSTDTAHWDETYAYLHGDNPEYPETNFNHYFYVEADFNLVLLYDLNGELVWGDAFDLEKEEPLPLEELFEMPLDRRDPLVHHTELDPDLNGLRLTKRGPLAVSSNAVLTTEGDGPSAGTMILGRLLDADKLAEIEAKTEISFGLRAIDANLGEAERAAVRELSSTDADAFHEVNGDHLTSYKVIRDVYGEPVFLLRAEMHRAITAIGLSAVQVAVLLLLIAGIIFMAAIWVLLQRFILAPVSSLTNHISQLRESGDLSKRIRLLRGDELGTLARQFDALTGELEDAREEMTEARDAALETARLKSEFLTTMSHEIRTPMNGVLGMAELLMQTHLSEKQQRFTHTIQRSADGLLTIINDILDLSKLEAGRIALECRDFGIRSLVEEVATTFAGTAHAKGLELVCEIPPELDAICKGDSHRLRQILVNLVGNAIKFTKRGEVVLGVSIGEQRENTYWVQFTVRDSGIGVPAEQQSRIFDAFSQVDASMTRQFGGTGLGLTICKRLVNLMGGKLGVESEDGTGSTFWLSVPLERSGMAATVWKLAPTSLGGIRALVAHDNPTSRALLERQLCAWQMECSAVASGTEALESLREAANGGAPVDIVLVDVDMPDIRGTELVGAIRADETIASVAVLLLCSVTSESDFERIGAQGRLTKPVRQSDLFDCISSALGHTGRRADAESRQAGDAGGAAEMRVLLAEDNRVNQEVAIAMLEELGCRCDLVGNGQEALRALESRHYDLVLMDCQMPVMDGYQATREIRRREAEAGDAQRVPIVAVTANVVEGDREKCLEIGMDEYLSKPFRQDQLRAMLDRWSGEPTPPAAVAEAPAPPRARKTDADGPIDHTALNAIRALESPRRPSLLADLIRNYLEHSEELLEDLRDAIDEEDADAVREAAHSLKSSSGNVGARELTGACREIEAMGRAGDLSQVKAAFDRLSEAYAQARAALEPEL
jgi:signal transduction histidine kinase/DNA-binding response OmpR family regulator/HPt (histidine-containing phosphotransfer) domain-containing protein